MDEQILTAAPKTVSEPNESVVETLENTTSTNGIPVVRPNVSNLLTVEKKDIGNTDYDESKK